MSTHSDALYKIMGVCEASPNYSRRTQTVHNIAMEALGLTKSQRDARHEKAKSRSDTLKKNTFMIGVGNAKRQFLKEVRENQRELDMQA